MLLNESLLLHIPSYVFWKDTGSRFVGCNELFLKDIAGLTRYEDLIGKTDYDLPSQAYATSYIKDDESVLSQGIKVKRIEQIPLANGTIITSETIKAPIINEGKVVGILGICHNITDRIKAEQLKLEIETHKAAAKEQKKFKKFVEKLSHMINTYQISNLQDQLGVVEKLDKTMKINLSAREQEILYYLYLNKSPKEIANILSIISGKEVSASTIHAIINKRLYVKFNVNSVSQLIEKAHAYNMIPFLITND